MIPDEAVEAALGAYHPGGVPTYAADLMRAALKAAAPHILSHERQQAADAHRDAIVNRETVDRLEHELAAARSEAWEEGVAYALPGTKRGLATFAEMRTGNPHRMDGATSG